MSFIVVGAGAVGAVIGALLAQAGHEVTFWVRPALRARLNTLSVERLHGAHTSIKPRCLSEGDQVPPSDWVLVCVRGEQLDQALRDVALHMGPARRVAIAAVSLSSVREQGRAAGLTGELFALHVSFGSYAAGSEPHAFTWFPFVLASMVTPDGERARLSAARELARTLSRAGLPARALLSMSTPMRFLSATSSVLALGWDLCDWQLARLAQEPVLRRETAAAMHEAARLVAPRRSLLSLLPRFAFALFLRVLPWLMSARGRQVWLRHGPKIRAQTDYIARELLRLGRARGLPTAALTRLFERSQRELGAR
jgi:2-dehydropantoate 2-reductase